MESLTEAMSFYMCGMNYESHKENHSIFGSRRGTKLFQPFFNTCTINAAPSVFVGSIIFSSGIIEDFCFSNSRLFEP